jgi:hypothetical protein
MGTSVKLETKANPARKQLGRAVFGFATARETFVLARAVELREMEHGMAEEPIRFGLDSLGIGFEPGDDVGIDAYGGGLFRRAIELIDSAALQSRTWGASEKAISRSLFAAMARMSRFGSLVSFLTGFPFVGLGGAA